MAPKSDPPPGKQTVDPVLLQTEDLGSNIDGNVPSGTGALLLDHLGEKKAAARLLSAIEAVVADKANHCPDLGGRATTRKVTDAVIAALETRQQIS